MTLYPHAYGYLIDADRGIVIGSKGKPIGSLHEGYRIIDGRRTVAKVRFQMYPSTGAHRIIWEAVNGPITGGLEINHRNGKKADNRISNLELTDRSGNVQHAFDTGLKHGLKGTQHPAHKLCDDDVREIRRARRSGEAPKSIAARKGVSRRTIYDVCLGKHWIHIADTDQEEVA